MEKAIIQEANVGLQESQYRQYFRKVYTNGNFKKTLKLGGLYFTISNCRVKIRNLCGYNLKRDERKKMFKFKSRFFKFNNGCCPHCGRKFKIDGMELHHVLPYSRFRELFNDERNMILLCHDCHKEVHCNPFLNIKLMENKASELGIDLNTRYNLTTNAFQDFGA